MVDASAATPATCLLSHLTSPLLLPLMFILSPYSNTRFFHTPSTHTSINKNLTSPLINIYHILKYISFRRIIIFSWLIPLSAISSSILPQLNFAPPSNLQQFLIRIKHDPWSPTFPFKNSWCKTCPIQHNSLSFIIPATKLTHPIQTYGTCSSSNLIYLLPFYLG
jgi:hypothetical protein